MRILLIDADTEARIKLALARAREKPIPWDALRHSKAPDKAVLTLAERGPVPQRNPEQVRIARGFRAALTFEEQPAGLFKHLSVSVDTPGRVPTVPAMQMIMRAFGFQNEQADKLWLEEFAPGHFAINAIELVEPRRGAAISQ